VDALPFGMPWEKGVKLTPLPEMDKPKYLDSLVQDALSKGARIANSHGGLTHHTFYFPPVVFPVKPDMQLYTVEQFGPVVPVAVYKDVKETLDYVVNGNYGQQVSIFGRDANQIGKMVDVLANQVCRINLNAQCQRGPDVFPFGGRKDSAEGTLSVSDALRCFSIRSMVAAPENDANKELLRGVLSGRTSNFINTDYIF
jgi:glyceraldehyde-3-phosphate dehydrogenase (NADP+)